MSLCVILSSTFLAIASLLISYMIIVTNYNHHLILLILRPIHLIMESWYSRKEKKKLNLLSGDSFSGLKLILGLDCKFTEGVYNVILLIVLVEM